MVGVCANRTGFVVVGHRVERFTLRRSAPIVTTGRTRAGDACDAGGRRIRERDGIAGDERCKRFVKTSWFMGISLFVMQRDSRGILAPL